MWYDILWIRPASLFPCKHIDMFLRFFVCLFLLYPALGSKVCDDSRIAGSEAGVDIGSWKEDASRIIPLGSCTDAY